MIPDTEEAKWLSTFLAEMLAQLEYHPGLTIEIEGQPHRWLQIIPQADDDLTLNSYLLNFAAGQPGILADIHLDQLLSLPPDTQLINSAEEGPIQMIVRADIPILALGLFVLEVFSLILGRSTNDELALRVEYGF